MIQELARSANCSAGDIYGSSHTMNHTKFFVWCSAPYQKIVNKKKRSQAIGTWNPFGNLRSLSVNTVLAFFSLLTLISLPLFVLYHDVPNPSFDLNNAEDFVTGTGSSN